MAPLSAVYAFQPEKTDAAAETHSMSVTVNASTDNAADFLIALEAAAEQMRGECNRYLTQLLQTGADAAATPQQGKGEDEDEDDAEEDDDIAAAIAEASAQHSEKRTEAALSPTRQTQLDSEAKRPKLDSA
ncbi:hypothetical protein THASP1DRAFT_29415 [Thamnocephalis sphaerospora]|uniref:EKC/KEOPS complex subunit GON7 n=1 Tax=Thamnocephalis sphaerospora TaxID=78915 RepID=A0A4P9XTC5_9FUNG|nr:hypothetical protein THASP1DRAFT_29415 [Thamnocephalis sphaerospora]|eukprot:RKP08791.1 hypothetical protein THASP1DRAFT_29415 [Thamnocephalis sphaerospora]